MRLEGASVLVTGGTRGIGKAIALPSILPHLHDTSGVHALPFALNAFALLAAGLLLGAAGSGLTLHRFLKV